VIAGVRLRGRRRSGSGGDVHRARGLLGASRPEPSEFSIVGAKSWSGSGLAVVQASPDMICSGEGWPVIA
jgi:hypothetical protein